MNEEEKDDLLKDTVAAIGVIKSQYDCEVIKNYEIPPAGQHEHGRNDRLRCSNATKHKLRLRRGNIHKLEAVAEGRRLVHQREA